MEHPRDIFEGRITKYTSLKEKQKRRLDLISVLRLISFLVVIVSIFFITKLSVVAGIFSASIFLVYFFMNVKWYHLVERKRNHTSNLIAINKAELGALNYDYQQFDNGAEFIDRDHPYTFDLDIFGPGSIFQYLNRTVTLNGKKMLSHWLSFPENESNVILRLQDAVKELIPKLDSRQNFMASGQLIRESASELKDIDEWLDEKNRYYGKLSYTIISYAVPLITLLIMFLTIFQSGWFQFLIMLFLGQLLIISFHLKTNNRVHAKIGQKLDIFRKYVDLLSYIEQEEHVSDMLKEIKDKIVTKDNPAGRSISRLSKIIAAFDNRLNIIAGVILNGVLLWDIQCMMRLEKWKTKNRNRVAQWLDALGIYDALCSLANYAFLNPGFVFPEPDSSVLLDFKLTGHPLIAPDERVDNNIGISGKGEFIIITGANMAGKSTFLRTVTINLILAMMGAPVCAKYAKFRPVKIFSSMRTSDSLQKNESYFYAELKRLKELLDLLKNGNDLFIVLDEILKGTNSADKQKGSRVVLGEIIKLRGSGLIATHDLDLAELEKEYPDNIRNKCFEVEIKGDNIYFDYILYDGITKKMNALLLMKQMGILNENNIL